MKDISTNSQFAKSVMTGLCMDHMVEEKNLATLNHVVIKAINPHYELPEKALKLCEAFGIMGGDKDFLPESRAAILKRYKAPKP